MSCKVTLRRALNASGYCRLFAGGVLPWELTAQQRWYVVHTQPHREAQAARQLENQNYRVFLPRFLKSRRHARKIETGLVPLFPRYLFIILDLTRDPWRSVNGTYGVDRLLMRAEEPEPVAEARFTTPLTLRMGRSSRSQEGPLRSSWESFSALTVQAEFRSCSIF